MSSEEYPLRPTARATDEHARKWPGMFEVGDPIRYTRVPEDWLPEWSLENLPLKSAQGDVNPPDACYNEPVHRPKRHKKKRHKRKDIMSNENTESNTPVDDRSPEQQAPRKSGSDAPAEETKPTKEPKEPKKPWEAPADAKAAVATMFEYAESGNKKVLAYFAREAIAARSRGKEVRESLSNED